MRVTLDQAVEKVNAPYREGRPYHASIMKCLRTRSPDIKQGMTPGRAAQKLSSFIRAWSRKVEHVYDVEAFPFHASDGRTFIAARVYVLKN